MATSDIEALLNRLDQRSTPALDSIMQRPRTRGVDFMAFARGSMAADELRQRRQADMVRDALLQDALQDRQDNRAAQAYLAPVLNNMNRAIQAGMSPADFLRAQMDQIAADPNFQSMRPEQQQIIWGNLMGFGQNQAVRLRQAGQFEEADRLDQRLGSPSGGSPLDSLRRVVDPAEFVERYNAQFPDREPMAYDAATGMIRMGSMQAPAGDVMANVQAVGIEGGITRAFQTEALGQRTQEAAQAAALRQQNEQWSWLQRLQGNPDPLASPVAASDLTVSADLTLPPNPVQSGTGLRADGFPTAAGYGLSSPSAQLRSAFSAAPPPEAQVTPMPGTPPVPTVARPEVLPGAPLPWWTEPAMKNYWGQ